jgi:hypothetical protein
MSATPIPPKLAPNNFCCPVRQSETVESMGLAIMLATHSMRGHAGESFVASPTDEAPAP